MSLRWPSNDAERRLAAPINCSPVLLLWLPQVATKRGVQGLSVGLVGSSGWLASLAGESNHRYLEWSAGKARLAASVRPTPLIIFRAEGDTVPSSASSRQLALRTIGEHKAPMVRPHDLLVIAALGCGGGRDVLVLGRADLIEEGGLHPGRVFALLLSESVIPALAGPLSHHACHPDHWTMLARRIYAMSHHLVNKHQ